MSNDKRYVEELKKKRARQSVNPDGADNQITQQLAEAREAVKKQTKAYIVAGGIGDAIAEIAIGDLGDEAIQVIDALNNVVTAPLEAERQLIGESFTAKALPQSATSQPKVLP